MACQTPGCGLKGRKAANRLPVSTNCGARCPHRAASIAACVSVRTVDAAPAVMVRPVIGPTPTRAAIAFAAPAIGRTPIAAAPCKAPHAKSALDRPRKAVFSDRMGDGGRVRGCRRGRLRGKCHGCKANDGCKDSKHAIMHGRFSCHEEVPRPQNKIHCKLSGICHQI